jgi:hypothetical protein
MAEPTPWVWIQNGMVQQLEPSAGTSTLARVGDRRSGVALHVRAFLEVGCFVLPALIGPLLLLEYLVGTYQVHPLMIDGELYPDGGFLFDLHTMWEAGRDVVTGNSPYPFVYPAPAALFMAPFGALPWKVAVVVFALVVMSAAALTLHVLGVRDWRCYGVALAWMPTTASTTLGALSTLLALAAAFSWRYRDRRLLAAAAVAGSIVLKLFLWPLIVWLIATRRFRAAATAVAFGVSAVVGSWAIFGFDGMLDYPRHLGDIAASQQARSYSPFALMRSVGIPNAWAQVGLVVMTILAVAIIALLARRHDGDRRSFVAAIGAALVLSPIVWLHYLVLLYVVIALYRQRLNVAWMIPLAYWLLPGQDSGGSTVIILGFYLITFAAVALMLHRRPRLFAFSR